MFQGDFHRARRLRRDMSLPEVLLWRELRKRPNGLKFRRQQPAAAYTADFYCHQARLVIELDGDAHNAGDRPSRDAERDHWFGERKVTVMRVAAREVLDNLEGVVSAIVARAMSGDTPPSGCAGHLPLQGRTGQVPPPSPPLAGEVASRSDDGGVSPYRPGEEG